jgi:hypothetical protein
MRGGMLPSPIRLHGELHRRPLGTESLCLGNVLLYIFFYLTKEAVWYRNGTMSDTYMSVNRRVEGTRYRSGRAAMLQAGRSRVRDPIKGIFFFPPLYLILPAALDPEVH